MALFARLIGMCSLAFLFAGVPGCGKQNGNNDEEQTKTIKKQDTVPVAGRTELKAPLNGVIVGRVILEGDMPTMPQVEKMVTHNDHVYCLAGEEFEKIDQKWIISKDRAVANVVIFLRPPQGKYFAITDEEKTR